MLGFTYCINGSILSLNYVLLLKKRRATGKYSRNFVCPTDDSILSCWLDKKERFGWSSKNENIRKMVNVKFKQKFT